MQGGKRELVLGVDDELLKNTSRSIPRADVAELTVQCLTLAEANNRCSAPIIPSLPQDLYIIRIYANSSCVNM